MKNGAPRGRAVRWAYLEPQYNPLKSSAGAFFGGGGAVGAGTAAGAPEADHRALVWKHRLPTQFSRRARLEAEELDEAPRSDEAKHRIDLRHLPFVTIDPARARDHDDAVFAEAAPPAATR